MPKFILPKHNVGDVFIRNYNGGDWVCILLSYDIDDDLNEYVWNKTMLPISDRIDGGHLTICDDTDLESMKYIGNIIEIPNLERFVSKDPEHIYSVTMFSEKNQHGSEVIVEAYSVSHAIRKAIEDSDHKGAQYVTVHADLQGTKR